MHAGLSPHSSPRQPDNARFPQRLRSSRRRPNPGGERETRLSAPVLALAVVGFGVSEEGGMTVRSASLNLAHTDMPIWGFNLLFNGFPEEEGGSFEKRRKKSIIKNIGSINVNHRATSR